MARWNSCNILHVAPDAKRVWSFDAKGGGFVLRGETRTAHTGRLAAKGIAKSWASLVAPKLNVAWLPADSVFLRVIELPASNFDETLAMVELQLEKLSPLPLAQIVWTMHVAGTHTAPAKGDQAPESLQTVIVVIAARAAVEEFLGRLEKEGFLADRLETPVLDQLAAVPQNADGVWLFPISLAGQNAALTAWRTGGVLRNLGIVALPPAGDRAAELKNQLAHLAWAGELEGWLTAPLKWHLVADPVNAAEWECLLRTAVNGPVSVSAPAAPAELAAGTARRAAAAGGPNLLPAEFATQYHQQFIDRLWLRGLLCAGVMYAFFCAVYFCATAVLGYRVTGVEKQAAALGGAYTNSLQLKAIYNVLSERQQLKYAALDCWEWAGQEMPPGVQLQRFSFADGQRLTLSGTVAQEQVNILFDFNTALKKKKANGQFVFDQQKGETVSPRFNAGGQGTWNLGLDLLRAEAEPQ